MDKLVIGITGCSGFLGSAIKEEFNNFSFIETRCLKNSKFGLFNLDELAEFVSDANIIIHLAGINRTEKVNEFELYNTLGTLSLLNAVNKYGKKGLHFIYASSLHVYGASIKPKKFTESSYLQPVDFFGLSKKHSEEIIKFYSSNYGLNCTVLRLSNVYGPKCRPFYNSVISTFMYLALQNKILTLYGSGNQKRDYIFIEDIIKIFNLLSIENPQDGYKVYNVCSGIGISLNDLIKYIEEIIGKKVNFIHAEDSNKSLGSLIGDPTKIRLELNFHQIYSLSEGLRKTAIWFKEVL